MRLPSGDQTGDRSSPGSKVRRDRTSRARSMIQMSLLSGVPTETATRRSSGDKARLMFGAGSPTGEDAAGAIEPGQLQVRLQAALRVDQSAILGNGRAHVTASLSADVLGERKRSSVG